MHLMAKYFNLPLRELQREKGIGETGGGGISVVFGHEPLGNVNYSSVTSPGTYRRISTNMNPHIFKVISYV